MLELKTDLILLSMQETQNKPLEYCHALTSLSLSKPAIRAWTRSRSEGASGRLQTQTQQKGSMGPGTGRGVSPVLQSSSLYYPKYIVERAASSLLWSTSLQVFKRTDKVTERFCVTAEAQQDTGSSVPGTSLLLKPPLLDKAKTAREHLCEPERTRPMCLHLRRRTWWLSSRAFTLHRPSISRSCTTFLLQRKTTENSHNLKNNLKHQVEDEQ